MSSPLKGKPKSTEVPEAVRKQLAKDIKEAEGPNKFEKTHSLNSYLQDNIEFYGKYTKTLQEKRAIQNLFRTWKGCKNLEEWLDKFYIQIFFNNKTAKGKATKEVNLDEPPVPTYYPSEIPTEIPTATPSTAKKTDQPKKQADLSTMTRTMSKNELGKRIIAPLPMRLYFVCLWAECNLNNVEYVISEDGYSVIERVKKPNPNNSSLLLSLGW